MDKKEKPKLRYATRNIRMGEMTWKSLKDKKIRSGLSWNLFMLKLLDNKK